MSLTPDTSLHRTLHLGGAIADVEVIGPEVYLSLRTPTSVGIRAALTPHLAVTLRHYLTEAITAADAHLATKTLPPPLDGLDGEPDEDA